MKYNIFSALVLTLILTGCVTQYGAKGINGGYSDKAIDRSSYFIRYDGSSLVGGLANHSQLTPLWNKRAQELCGDSDYFQETRKVRLDTYGKESNFGTPAIYGMAYCNNRFIDTRKQSEEENFLQYINLPYDVFTYKEISPLWGMLIDGKYKELQEEVDLLYQSYEEKSLSEQELSAILNTFSRINPSAEKYLTEWVKDFPESYIALYSRAIFYHNYSWFKRGSGWAEDLTDEQISGLKKYRQLAEKDLEKSLKINDGLCISYTWHLRVLMSYKDLSLKEIFANAKEHCPKSIALRSVYLKNLQPRWGGTVEEMEEFVSDSIKESDVFFKLKALVITEQGDQLFFKKKYTQALRKYEEAISFSNFSYTYNQRGYALEKIDRYIESIHSYEMATNINPYSNTAYEGLTRVLLRQNNLVGALIASSYLTAMNNQESINFEREGNIFYHMRRYDDALVSYKKAAILSSNKAIHRHKIKKAEYQLEVRKGDRNDRIEKTSI